MGVGKSGSQAAHKGLFFTRRRIHLLSLFFCATLLFILVFVWQIQSQSGAMFAALINREQPVIRNVIESHEVSTDAGDTAVPLDTINTDMLKQVVSSLTVNQNSTDSTNNTDSTNLSLEGLYVKPSDTPLQGDISGTFDSGLAVNPDSVMLGTDTTGDYVSSIVAGFGMQGDAASESAAVALSVKSGDGITVDTNGVSVALQPGGGMGIGLEGLTLLTSCSDGQLLKWDILADSWGCASDNTGSGSGFTLTVGESDGSVTAAPVSAIEFGPASGSSDEFAITDQGGGVARIRTGTAVPLTNNAVTITGSWTYANEIAADGGISCADCIALGAETTGNYMSGLLAGGGLSVSGSGSEGATPTVSLDTTHPNTWTGGQTFNGGLSINGDTFTDFTGTGLSVTGGALTAVLGTSVDSSEIVDGTVTGTDIASNTITSSLILDGTLVANDIADGTLTLAKLGQNGCATNEIIMWNGSAWACALLAASPNAFQIVGGDTGNAVADTTGDTVTFMGGNGLTSAGSDANDSVTFDVDLASGSGLAFSSGALTLQSCGEGQILKYVSGSWACASDNGTLAASYTQQLAGTDNITVGSSLTPLLTNGSGVAQSLPITVGAGNEVSFNATAQMSSTLVTGLVNYVVIRDDNHDNDCATTAGDGTIIGSQVSGFIANVAQPFVTSFAFSDTTPSAGTNYYQLCASSSIALSTTTATVRALKLEETNL